MPPVTNRCDVGALANVTQCATVEDTGSGSSGIGDRLGAAGKECPRHDRQGIVDDLGVRDVEHTEDRPRQMLLVSEGERAEPDGVAPRQPAKAIGHALTSVDHGKRGTETRRKT